MIFKYSKTVPTAIRKTLNFDDYVMYYTPRISSDKSSHVTQLLAYHIWQLFDTVPNSLEEKNERDKFVIQISRRDSHYGNSFIDHSYLYGLPTFPDLIMYLIVLIKKRDVVPNAEEELNLFRRALLIPRNRIGANYPPPEDNVVDYLENFIDETDLSLIDDVLKDMIFTSSLTHDEEGLKKLEEEVEKYVMLVEPLCKDSVQIQHYDNPSSFRYGPEFETPYNVNVLIRTMNYMHNHKAVMFLPEFIAHTVVFRKYKEVTHKTTAEDMATDYAHVLQATSGFKKTYYVLIDDQEMRFIHKKIKGLVPTNARCVTSSRLYSTEAAKEKGLGKFKAKLRMDEETLRDNPDSFRSLLNILSDIDPDFKIVGVDYSLDYNAYDPSSNINNIKYDKVPAILSEKIREEHNHRPVRTEAIKSLQKQARIVEGFRPTKIGSVYKQLDDDVFNLLAQLYFRKILTISLNTDTLKPLNRLKLYGLKIFSLEYSYYNWEEVLEYLEEKHSQ